MEMPAMYPHINTWNAQYEQAVDQITGADVVMVTIFVVDIALNSLSPFGMHREANDPIPTSRNSWQRRRFQGTQLITEVPSWIAPEIEDRVAAAQQSLRPEETRLTPLFEALDKEVDYDTLRIVLACQRNRANSGTDI